MIDNTQVEYRAGLRAYEVTVEDYQTLIFVSAIQAIIEEAKVNQPWLIDMIKEWLQ